MGSGEPVRVILSGASLPPMDPPLIAIMHSPLSSLCMDALPHLAPPCLFHFQLGLLLPGT